MQNFFQSILSSFRLSIVSDATIITFASLHLVRGLSFGCIDYANIYLKSLMPIRCGYKLHGCCSLFAHLNQIYVSSKPSSSMMWVVDVVIVCCCCCISESLFVLWNWVQSVCLRTPLWTWTFVYAFHYVIHFVVSIFKHCWTILRSERRTVNSKLCRLAAGRALVELNCYFICERSMRSSQCIYTYRNSTPPMRSKRIYSILEFMFCIETAHKWSHEDLHPNSS